MTKALKKFWKSIDQSIEEILEKYEYLFEGIGTLPG
jgi:hypothetical protein